MALSLIVHILMMPLHILGSEGFAAEMTFSRVVPISKMVTQILLAIALEITVRVVVSRTFERTMAIFNTFSPNRPVETVPRAGRIRCTLVPQDLALSIFLWNEEAVVYGLSLICQLKSASGHARCANYRLLLVRAKP